MRMMSTRYLLVLTIVGLLMTSSAEMPTVNTTARVVFALRDFFQVDCFALVSSGHLRSHVTTARLGRIILMRGVPTAMLDSATLVSTRNNTRHCLRPLNLLLYDVRDVTNQLTQLSQRMPLSGPVWLLFVEDHHKINEVFVNVNIPFDCEFLVAQMSGREVQLYEVYRVSGAWPLRSERFGSWSADKGLTAPRGGLYTRRDSLHGLTLRATNVHDPPLSIVTVENGTMHLSGFCGSIWGLLETRMNFTTIHGIPKEGGNRWEEMMFQLIRGEADVTATYITHTLDRDRVIDFTIPLARIPLRIFLAEPTGREVEWSDFLSPFSPALWLALLVSTLAAATLLALLYNVIRRVAHASEDAYPLLDAVFLVFGSVFCQQGHARTPKTSALRIVHIVTLLVGIIAINSYSGALISNLTVVIPTLPFRTMEGLYSDSDYNFGMINKSLTHIQLTNATGGILKLLFDRYVKNQPINAPPNYLIGFQRVCNHRFAFVALSEALTLLRDQLNCTVIYIPQHFATFSASLAFPKGSPYRGLFNHNLLRLLTGGVLRILHRTALNEKPSSPSDDIASINLETVTPIFSIVAAGIAVATLLVCAELMLGSYHGGETTASRREAARRFQALRRRPAQVSPVYRGFLL